ncbi:YfbM family protein [Occallatibacter savannae]|uniref:YfbM family protein n=1 Tax=Occallatibacter savannae TaxID=1002691 RepID=UPI000D692210|nr:YfbM family protein [Occallatibacter savannae]
MSMNAVFIQVTPDELARIEKVPALAESLFTPGVTSSLAAFGDLSKKMEDRIRAAGPQLLGQALANLDPRIREQLEQRMGATAAQFSSGQGGDRLLQVMKERRERAMAMSVAAKKDSPKLSLDKEWHGVHYLLCGKVEPDGSFLSQAVLGGTPLGDDDEGFSGYGPARYFAAAEVARLSAELGAPGLESEARARFDAEKMNSLQIYPGFRAEDIEGLVASVRRLRDFYADAAQNGNAIVTCLV